VWIILIEKKSLIPKRRAHIDDLCGSYFGKLSRGLVHAEGRYIVYQI
jgi:hypothetical protein